MPGCIASSTRRTFSAVDQRLRRCTEVMTSTREYEPPESFDIVVLVDLAAVEVPDPRIRPMIFGRGRHQCPGRPLALRELVLVAERLTALSPENYDVQIIQNGRRPRTFRHPGAIRMRARCPHADVSDA